MTTSNVTLTTHLLAKRGNTSVSSTYTGLVGELVVDTDLTTVRVQDGVTAGGHILANITQVDSINANLGTYQTTVNANLGTATTNITTLLSNAGSQATTLQSLQSNASIQQSLIDTLTGNAATQFFELVELTSNAASQANELIVLISNASSQATDLTSILGNAGTQQTSLNNINANLGTVVATTIPGIDANLGTATTNITTLFSNAGSQATSITTLDANIGSQQTYSNITHATISSFSTLDANLGTATTNINTLDANLGTATTNITTLLSNAGSQATSIDTLTANAGAQATSINTLDANLGTAVGTTITTLDANLGTATTAITSLVSNAGVQATSINTLDANIGSYQSYANTSFIVNGTNSGNVDITAGNVIITPSSNLYLNGTTYTSGNINTHIYGGGFTTGDFGGTSGISIGLQNVDINVNGNITHIGRTVNGYVGIAPTTNVERFALEWYGGSGSSWYWIDSNSSVIWPDGTTQSTAYTTGVDANLGTATTAITSLVSNAGVQATSINTLDANIGSFQTYSNAQSYISNVVEDTTPQLGGNLDMNSKSIIGSLQLEDGTQERFSSLTSATGTVAHDCTNGTVFYHTSISANFTANFTNLELDSSYATAITLVLVQGGTAYIPNAVQIGGAGQTINWQGNAEPTGTINRIDAVSFTILNNSGTYTVLGQLTDF